MLGAMENQAILSVGAILLALVATFAMLRIRTLSRKQDTAMKLMRQQVKTAKKQNELLAELNELLREVLAKGPASAGLTPNTLSSEEE